MFDPTVLMMNDCIQQLIEGYRRTYGNLNADYLETIPWVAKLALEAIARGDAPYHDLEHTILVTLVGQEILRGKQVQDGTVTPDDWLNTVAALLCHDIGYVKGVCRADQASDRLYDSGRGEWVFLPAGTTDASLTPYHVDRGQRFVYENLAAHPLIDVYQVNRNIELTRFPAPTGEMYQDTGHYPGLTRAADLIGQLSDPRYLQKLPALFYEFAEVGVNTQLGYHHPDDLRASYPRFYRTVVSPYIQDAVRYLKLTQQGRQILANLYANVLEVEEELLAVAA